MPLYNGATHTYRPAPKVFGSTAPRCPTCDRSVYAAEQVLGPGSKAYHALCLKCTACSKLLDPTTVVDHDNEPYCKPCYGRCFGPKGVGFGNAVSGEYTTRTPPGSPLSPKGANKHWSPRAGGAKSSAGSFGGDGITGSPTAQRVLRLNRDHTGASHAGTADVSAGGSPAGGGEMSLEEAINELRLPADVSPGPSGAPADGGGARGDRRLDDGADDWDHERSPSRGEPAAAHTPSAPASAPVPQEPPLAAEEPSSAPVGPEEPDHPGGGGGEDDSEDGPGFVPPPLPNPFFNVTARSASSPCLIRPRPRPGSFASSPASPVTSPPATHRGLPTPPSSQPSTSPRVLPSPLPGPPGGGGGRPGSPLKHSSASPRAAAGAYSYSGARIPGAPLSPTSRSREFGLSVGPGQLGGGPSRCPRCGEVVYFAEQVLAVGKKWHKRCLRCAACSKALDASLSEREGTPYCKKCYGGSFGAEAQGFVLRPGFATR